MTTHRRATDRLGAEDSASSDSNEINTLRQRVIDLEGQLQHALTDPVTGLPARSLFTRRAVSQHHLTAAVVLFDIDAFKEFNDTFGHRAGDYVLAHVAHRLRTALGPAAVIGRLGGDEFAGALPSVPDCDRMLDRLTSPLVVADHASITPRLSCGIAAEPDLTGLTFSEALHAADVAMYTAKQTGRRWCRYEIAPSDGFADSETPSPIRIGPTPAEPAFLQLADPDYSGCTDLTHWPA